MPAAVLPQKRVFGEASNARRNVGLAPPVDPTSPTTDASEVGAKKRRLDLPLSSSPAAGRFLGSSQPSQQRGPGTSRGRPGSSQPTKSVFEAEVLEKLSQDLSERKQSSAEKDQAWDRPPVAADFSADTNALSFQQIEAEEGSLSGGHATVKLFGVTEQGNSVLLHVTGFRHYLYVAAPAAFTPADCTAFHAYLETQVAQHQPAIHAVQMTMRESILGFQNNTQNPFLKITVTDPKHIARVRFTIEKRKANWKGLWGQSKNEIMTYDNLQYVMRFMVDMDIFGMSWVTAPAGKYRLIGEQHQQSNCQIEAEISSVDLVAHKPVGEWSKMAPLRILSFDIECAGRKGIFPEAEHDPVIQIANVVTRYGEKKPFVRNVFCLGQTSSIVATEILEYEREEALLAAWRTFLLRADPDIITGYNISNFDFPYLLDRARHLKVARFAHWTRLPSMSAKVRDPNFNSKQMGNRDTKTTTINGRLQLDLLQLIQRDHQLRSYTLNSVCSTFLGEQKEDVHHTMITELFNGTAENRRRLALYCLKDAYLPQRLMDKLSCLENYTEMARVTGVPFNFLLTRGQQVKFVSQLFRKALEQKLVVPNLAPQGTDEQYTGATVIEPVRRFYKEPVATLDFASLYPSIMQAHNLCYTTLVNNAAIEAFGLQKDIDYIVTPNNDKFVTATRRKGLLAQILEELLAARKQAKRELAQETDAFRKAVLNGRQLALKISANSVYGLTGATTGKLPCLEIARSTTSYGRQMIERTKNEVEARYSVANGYAHDAQVVYGDTDSVMVRFGTKDLAEAMRLGEEAAQYVSAKFAKPIKLEFEKVYYPYLLINKKRYAGLYWTRPDRYDKMDTKGIETVRRDNCLLVQTVIDKVLRMMLIDQDEEGAQTYVKNTISDLLQNKIDLSKLVITKALTKESYKEEPVTGSGGKPGAPPPPAKSGGFGGFGAPVKGPTYKAKQAHAELAERMRKRDAGSAPGLGDRVAYVMVKGAAGSKNFERSEDPLYVLEHNVPIDTKYYLDNQLAKPLGRIFEPILGEAKARLLLTGDHTRAIAVAAPSVGGLMRFATKTQTCMACKKPLTGAGERGGAVCADDGARVGELYRKTLDRVSDLEVRFGRLWTQCQRCQGSMHCEVICSSKDCPIFYMRMKAKKDLEDGNKELQRFDVDAAATW